MKLVITSDLHLGDPNCVLVKKNEINGRYELDKGYEKFKQHIPLNTDYLILIGDVFEVAINSYKEAFESSKVFFKKLKEDCNIDQIIYIPGNHDFDLWQYIETEVNVTKRIGNCRHPREFKWSVPCVIDDRINSDDVKDKLILPSVKRNQDKSYGGLFLNGITENSANFIVAYPNVYLITNDNQSIMMTHGQYFDMYWSFLGNLLLECADKYLDNTHNGKFTLKELIQVNYPLNQLGSSGVGQAGIFTDFARNIQREIKDKKFDNIEEIIKNLEKWLDNKLDYKFIKEYICDLCIKSFGKSIVKNLENSSDGAQFNKDYLTNDNTKERFLEFLFASMNEAKEIKNLYSIEIPEFNRIIFGHTHQPIPLGSQEENVQLINNIKINNTGGWLMKKNTSGNDEFVGASVFLYETGQALTSVNVKKI